MGISGYGPFASDSAADWAEPIRTRIVSGLRSRDPEIVRAAAGLVVVLDESLYMGSDIAYAAIERLRELLANERYLADWREPAKARVAIEQQVKQLKVIARRNR